jgi:hypothetical protein
MIFICYEKDGEIHSVDKRENQLEAEKALKKLKERTLNQVEYFLAGKDLAPVVEVGKSLLLKSGSQSVSAVARDLAVKHQPEDSFDVRDQNGIVVSRAISNGTPTFTIEGKLYPEIE